MTSRREIETRLSTLRDSDEFVSARASIRRGRFARVAANPDYQARLTYTAALREFVYDAAAMNTVLTRRDTRRLFFRTFGYAGCIDFVLYPECWLRDLPLLDFGADAYLGSGIVLGTNQVSPCQRFVRTGPIQVGNRTVFDQQCMIGLDSVVGDDCVVGVRSCLGIGVKVGNGVTIGALSNIGHGCRIGAGTVIGSRCDIGNFCELAPGTVIEEFTTLRSRTKLA